VGGFWSIHNFGIAPTGLAILLVWIISAAIGTAFVLRSRHFTALCAIVVIAFALRLGMLLVTKGSIPAEADPFIYHNFATSLAQGQDMIWSGKGYPWRALFPPLYPLLLAATYLVTHSATFAPMALSLVVDGLAALIIYRLASAFGTVRAGQWAAFLYLIWPDLIISSAFPSKEGLANLLFLTCLLILFRLRQEGARTILSAAFGAAVALLALTQPAWVTLPALLLLPLAFVLGVPAVARIVAVSLAVFALVMLPWWIRNWIELGGFVPLTTSVGLNLHNTVTGVWPAPSQSGEIAFSGELFTTSLQLIAANPVPYLTGRIVSAGLGLATEHALTWNLAAMGRSLEFPAGQFALVLQFSLIFQWAAGLWAFWGRKLKPVFGIVIAICLAQIVLFNVWFEFSQRHRAYLTPLILIAVSVAIANRAGKSTGVVAQGL
jgi:4-amino-4-deoxy-L-arabinose transferase-like glycosyltransferase